jgi:16S rRNA (adenine1518-N6/adenine1519-N6)-dimethyltransferase
MIEPDGLAEDPKRSPPWASLRAELEAAGFRPSKSLGQNFLLDGNLARAIVEDAGLDACARVLEVGCGPGALTEPLARRGLEVLAVEIDPRLLALARARMAGFANVRFLEADVLAGKDRIAPQVLEELRPWPEWHLVSNLPYSVTGPLLASLSRLERPPLSMTVLVQAEMADRLVAEPGTKAWGSLSAKLALVYLRSRGRGVGPQLFWPRPRVQSSVVRMTLRPAELAPAALAAYDRLVSGIFQSRRKTLRNALIQAGWAKAGVDRTLAELPGWKDRRPEDLGPQDLLFLVGALEPRAPDIP